MDAFTNFLANNYVWFLIISLILIFALIGYLVDTKEIKNGKRPRKKKEEIKVVDFSTIDQSKSLNQSIKEENNTLNLDQYVNQNKEKEQIKTDELETNNLENSELETIDLDNNELPDLDDNNDMKFENEFKQDVNE
jgi:MFS superfamily sulfate permease-like transporter